MNYKSKYNTFNDIKYIRNRTGCRWDTNAGYEAELINGENSGFDSISGFDNGKQYSASSCFI